MSPKQDTGLKPDEHGDIVREGYNVISLGDKLETLKNKLRKVPQKYGTLESHTGIQRSERWTRRKALPKAATP